MSQTIKLLILAPHQDYLNITALTRLLMKLDAVYLFIHSFNFLKEFFVARTEKIFLNFGLLR